MKVISTGSKFDIYPNDLKSYDSLPATRKLQTRFPCNRVKLHYGFANRTCEGTEQIRDMLKSMEKVRALNRLV